MPDITTDVFIIGTGPAGSASAALLSTYGVDNMVINRYRWLANMPRAHITNQRTMEVLRDLGREVEDEVYLFAAEQDLMGENVFCTSLAGEEIGRVKSWGKHPLSRAEHQLSSPTFMNAVLESLRTTTVSRSSGTQARMSPRTASPPALARCCTTNCSMPPMTPTTSPVPCSTTAAARTARAMARASPTPNGERWPLKTPTANRWA